MTSNEISSAVELRAQTAEDAAFVDGLVRGHLAAALAGAPGLDPGPLLEMQVRSREMMLGHRFPGLERRVGWIDGAPVAGLLTGPLDGALHVVEIIIAPEARRRGVGAAILNQVIAEARASDRDATAFIFASNTASLGLFASAGFTVDLPPGAAQATATLRTAINVTQDMAV
jgi:ribosomal protein S18 acetylase RimI-like enzyme